MLFDPYLIFVKCFSTWLRLRILMGFTMAWCIILIGLSGWMTESSGGSFVNLNFPSNRTYSSWSNSVCNAAPYKYLSPFQFSFSSPDGSSSSSSSICPWPAENSELRFTIAVVGLVHLGVLFFKTPLSMLARISLAAYALLFFASFVLDASASATALTYCQSKFVNSMLYEDITAMKLSLTCNSSNFSGVAVIDLIISALFFIMHTAWGLTTDLYVDKGGKKSADKKELLKSMA